MHSALALVLLGILLPRAARGTCSMGCSGHGHCEQTASSSCICVAGWTEADCSLRTCPRGRAWGDIASATDSAHAFDTECSLRGGCDRSSGKCKCDTGFEGPACDRAVCPGKGAKGDCNGNGRCMTMGAAAAFHGRSYELWDKDMMTGCLCDRGWTGYDCSLRACPRGNDPFHADQENEIQTLFCQCNATCAGTLTVGLRRDDEHALSVEIGSVVATANAANGRVALIAALESIPSIGYGGVAVHVFGNGPLCDTSGVTTTINFTHTPGNLAPLSVWTSTNFPSGGGAVVHTVQDGTRDLMECSDRGSCSSSTGLCTCMAGFGASDGFAGAAEINVSVANGYFRNDCGHNRSSVVLCAHNCFAHGKCDETTRKCICDYGYTGHDCMKRTCPVGRAWFDVVFANNTSVGGGMLTGGHAVNTECSNRGICNRVAATCTCAAGFEGAACERMKCPGASSVCSGQGSCKTMAELAQLASVNGDLTPQLYGTTGGATTWDADMVVGCYCDRQQYHGPLNGDLSMSTGHDCALYECPTGDDPEQPWGVFEQQSITCNATSGLVSLSFRQQATGYMGSTTAMSAVKAHLEELNTVQEIDVVSTHSALCDSAGATHTITFKSTLGNLPLMIATTSGMSALSTVKVGEVVTGTKQDLRCSKRGTCDETIGRCSCFTGYGSSNGDGAVGRRADCGFIDVHFAGGNKN